MSSRLQVDLVQMKAIIWNDESLGAKFDVTDIPDDMKEKAAEWREKLVETVVEVRACHVDE